MAVKRHLKLIYIVTMAAAVAFVLVLSVFWINRAQLENARQNLTEVIALVSMQIEENGRPEDYSSYAVQIGERIGRDTRVTFINGSGEVLGDSGYLTADMQDHSGRAEFVAALEQGDGEAVRKSETSGIKMLYVAHRIEDDLVLRIGMPVGEVYSYTHSVIPPVICLCLLLFVVFYQTANAMAEQATKPLGELAAGIENMLRTGQPVKVEEAEYSELAVVVHQLNRAGRRIQSYIEQLRRKSGEIENILAAADDGIVVLDGDGRVISVNQAAAAFFGSGRTDVQFEMICRDQSVLAATRLAVEKREATTCEIPEAVRDGRTYRVFINPAVKDNSITGVVLFVSDVTELVRLARARSDFVANVSHELKTPLTTITGFAELLQQDMVPDEEKKKAYLGLILEEGRRLQALINDILHLSELESGQQPERERVELRPIAEEVVSLLEPMSSEKGIAITVSGEAEVQAGRESMREVLRNLVENAVKYNVKDGRVVVKLIQREQESCVLVEDTGIGIAPEDQQRVFERFYRVDKARRRENGSTGLGLAIVKHIVQIYGGRISLRSEPGKGTAIEIAFPRAQDQ